MIAVALFGAGGNMGTRLTRALRDDPGYEVRHVEPGERGRARLAEAGIEPVEPAEAVRGAQVAVLAVPDTAVAAVAAGVVGLLEPGTTVMCLDPAGPYAGCIPERDDVGLFVTHPTHPPLFDLLDEEDAAARRDYWGGGIARQSIVNALVRGGEEHYERGEALARAIFRPVLRSHRVSLEQLALLEPALAETVAITCIAVMREAFDAVVERGVPEPAASDFLLGHLLLGTALIFDRLDWKLSAGAEAAVEAAKRDVFRHDWKQVLEPEAVRRSVAMITQGA